MVFHHLLGSLQENEGFFFPVDLRCLLFVWWCHSHMELSRSAIVSIYVKLINTKAEALLWYVTRERETEISEVVGCTVDHVQTFAHHISLHLAD